MVQSLSYIRFIGEYMKNKRNLFIIDDYVDPQKDTIYRILKNKKKDYLFLDGQPFCNNVFEPRYYRQVWLELCRSVSEQLDMEIAFCGALSPETIESMGNTDFFNIHWLTIISSEEKILARLEISKIKESTGAILRNKWAKANYKAVFPQVKLLDITEISDELAAEAIDSWIVSHSSHKE